MITSRASRDYAEALGAQAVAKLLPNAGGGWAVRGALLILLVERWYVLSI